MRNPEMNIYAFALHINNILTYCQDGLPTPSPCEHHTTAAPAATKGQLSRDAGQSKSLPPMDRKRQSPPRVELEDVDTEPAECKRNRERAQ